jgi:hypothetical protein
MSQRVATKKRAGRRALAKLYEPDETAWLEESARLIRAGHFKELDYENLASYLEDMARRDRREIVSRLTVLIAHLLKWYYQPDHRTKSWELTVLHQRQELANALTGTLRRHAEQSISKCYERAREWAEAETEIPEGQFPSECPFTLDQILTEELA